jgi:hypothetical protein
MKRLARQERGTTPEKVQNKVQESRDRIRGRGAEGDSWAPVERVEGNGATRLPGLAQKGRYCERPKS